MLARLAAFYIVVAGLDLYMGGRLIALAKASSGVGIEIGVAHAVTAIVLGPLFNVIVSFVAVKRVGRLSGFAAGLVNLAGFEGMMLALVGARTTSTTSLLGVDLTKLVVPWALSAIPWVRRHVLARPRRGSRAALFGASAIDFPAGSEVAPILALTDPLERGIRGALSRRPGSWDVNATRVEDPLRDVPTSLRFALLTSGPSILAWAALSLGLLCVGLLGRCDQIRNIPLEMAGVDVVAQILDCGESPQPSLLASLRGQERGYNVRYRYQVDGVSYDGASFTDLACLVPWADEPVRTHVDVLYWPGHPERSMPHYSVYREPFIWTLLLALGAVLGIHSGLGRLFEALRGVRALRRGHVVHGETLPGFPVALAAGSRRFVPVIASGPGRPLLVEVLEPRTRSSAGPALLVPDHGPVVPWDQLPARPGVDQDGRLLGPSWRSLVVPGLLPMLALGLAIVAAVPWIRLVAGR